MMYRLLVEVVIDNRNKLSAEGLVMEWLSTAPGVVSVKPQSTGPVFDWKVGP